MVTNTGDRTSEYANLPYFLLVFQSTTCWLDTGANVHVCSNTSLFSSYQEVWDSFMMMGNESHASIHFVGTIDPKLTSGKIVELKNMQHISTVNKNLVSNFLLCRDDFKVVIDSNKFVTSMSA
jgi:hypothetical protein